MTQVQNRQITYNMFFLSCFKYYNESTMRTYPNWERMEKNLMSTYIFSKTIPLAWEAPPNGLAFKAVPKWDFLYDLSCHLWSRRRFLSFLAHLNPRGFPMFNFQAKKTETVKIVHEDKTIGQRLHIITSSYFAFASFSKQAFNFKIHVRKSLRPSYIEKLHLICWLLA